MAGVTRKELGVIFLNSILVKESKVSLCTIAKLAIEREHMLQILTGYITAYLVDKFLWQIVHVC